MAARGSRFRPRTLTGRLLIRHAAVMLVVLAVLAVLVDRVLEGRLVAQLTDALAADARVVQQLVEGDESPQADVRSLAPPLGVRITIIRTDGVVVADSEADPATMDNQRDRPEVREALRGAVGVSSRTSDAVDVAVRYLALPPEGDRVVRLSLSLKDVRAQIRTMRLLLAAGVGLATVASLAGLILFRRSLSRPLRRMAQSLERVGRGDLAAEGPVEGTDELATLARTVNRIRDEVASRITAMEQDRATRDAILGGLNEGVVLFDRAGTVLYQNESSRRLLGSLGSARNLDPSALRELIATLQGGLPPSARREPTTFERGSGKLQATAERVAGQDLLLLVVRDVAQTQAVEAVRRDFVANASHELKTPVASIRALAETISSAASHDPVAVPRFAAQIEREAVRLSRIVSDLLDLSRLEIGPTELSEVRLDELVEEEAERHRGPARKADLSLTVEANGPAVVRGSPNDLTLLVRNLVENAIQYTRPGGSVTISVMARERTAELMIRDTGIGIPMKDQTRVFERFYRVDRARSRETGGTGLGLSIVRHVAENHGGTVSMDSLLGRGTTVAVQFPTA
jgi:two-component system, OmpR family, phosphate regulon sensor histidine kinase PhoR